MTEKFGLGLYITRHGECLANVEKRLVGQTETPLTQRGIDQAHAIGEQLRGTKIDIIMSSPLSRARDTANIIAQYSPPNKLVAAPKLKPQSLGVLEGYTRKEAMNAGLSRFLHTPKTDKYTHYVPGGETAKQAMERIVPVYLLLQKVATEKDYAILLVLHNSVIRSIAGSVWGVEPQDWVSLAVPNCEVFKIVREQPFSFQSIFLKSLAGY